MKAFLTRLYRWWIGPARVARQEENARILREVEFMKPLLDDLGRKALLAWLCGDVARYEIHRRSYNQLCLRWDREVSKPLARMNEKFSR